MVRPDKPHSLFTPAEPARRAAAFQRMRDAHETEMAEDYTELIGDLIDTLGEARLTDLAENIGVSHATAAKVVKRLQRSGLVHSQPYRSIHLTESGRAMADASRRRHQLVYDFLRAIGVGETTAEADAEGIEHHCSEETLAMLAKAIETLAKP